MNLRHDCLLLVLPCPAHLHSVYTVLSSFHHPTLLQDCPPHTVQPALCHTHTTPSVQSMLPWVICMRLVVPIYTIVSPSLHLWPFIYQHSRHCPTRIHTPTYAAARRARAHGCWLCPHYNTCQQRHCIFVCMSVTADVFQALGRAWTSGFCLPVSQSTPSDHICNHYLPSSPCSSRMPTSSDQRTRLHNARLPWRDIATAADLPRCISPPAVVCRTLRRFASTSRAPSHQPRTA